MPRSLGTARWTWARLARVATFALVALLALDLGLAPRERELEALLWSGRLRNAPGPAIADASRWALLEAPDAKRREAVLLVGSSVSFGPNLADDETLAAQLAHELDARGRPRPVANLSQPGGSPRTPVPVAAALGTRPVRALLVELLVPSYAEREHAPAPDLALDELALLQAASPAQRTRLAAAGLEPRLGRRIETRLTSVLRKTWRLYRLRGTLWWDDEFTASYLVWSLRREVATAGFLPKRFHGQSTNVGKLPWRQAYVGGQRPSANQRFRVPTGRVSEPDFALLELTAELARAARVAVYFYEIPLNLAFQREFALMNDADLARLEKVRGALLARMAAAGMRVVQAPPVPDDAFLDKAHLTPLGTRLVASTLAGALDDAALGPDPRP